MGSNYTGADNIQGDINHDVADTATSCPMKTGGVAFNHDGTQPGTPVAEGDRVSSLHAVDGRKYVDIGHPYGFTVFTTTAAAVSAAAALKAAPGAGLSFFLTDLIVATGSSVGSITLYDDSTTALVKVNLIANSTFHHQFRQPVKLTANKPLGWASVETVVSIHVSGFIAP